MENAQFYILAGLSGVSIAFCAILFYKIRSVIYLLEQPVVKKMSPQLKLKPVKIDEIDNSSSRNDARPAAAAGNRAPRPNFERPEGGERQNRDGQHRHERGPRPERTEGGDRGPRNDRGDRNGFRDRDRGPRNERTDRHGGRDGSREGGDRNRNRTEGFASANGNANGAESTHAAESAPMASRPAAVPTPDNSHNGPALAPRRPLPSTVEHETTAKEYTPPEPVSAADAADALFMRDDSDIQHGRRNQLKKKPKFDVSDEDVKTATTEETKA